jgi:hypothetical protein
MRCSASSTTSEPSWRYAEQITTPNRAEQQKTLVTVGNSALPTPRYNTANAEFGVGRA